MASFYNADQDALIMSVGKEAVAEGTPLPIAFLKIADEMGRPVSSIQGRYKRLQKALKNGNDSTTISESDRIILKLKALHREKDRNAEKVDLFKNKFHALQKEHDNLKQEYRNLQLQYQTLIDTVKKVIGEEDGGNEFEAS
ncbi:hypothetical protein BSK59_16265 [Paenibacillus odorifer]|uniref:hypothetical protein n=1 Tax=Paenibacillus odorifer TaxID=189426 RepID=UPI00096C316F|nr:hypothetical protein [Paenibacillus odorifer]OME54133.1 hypothetical protein BSK59_16265 [Paenibacillus odorifer]